MGGCAFCHGPLKTTFEDGAARLEGQTAIVHRTAEPNHDYGAVPWQKICPIWAYSKPLFWVRQKPSHLSLPVNKLGSPRGIFGFVFAGHHYLEAISRPDTRAAELTHSATYFFWHDSAGRSAMRRDVSLLHANTPPHQPFPTSPLSCISGHHFTSDAIRVNVALTDALHIDAALHAFRHAVFPAHTRWMQHAKQVQPTGIPPQLSTGLLRLVNATYTIALIFNLFDTIQLPATISLPSRSAYLNDSRRQEDAKSISGIAICLTLHLVPGRLPYFSLGLRYDNQHGSSLWSHSEYNLSLCS
ncbi:hypothetical protein DFH06DRAFT_1290696 [Mycena polygramma]|nr:hypothetical protein DFH06DRAFT_1290696 [Mycena polygramma]